MARKPRRSLDERIDEKLANLVIDAGDMDAGENAMPKARPPGKPPRDWAPIDVMIDWYRANDFDPAVFSQAMFIESVRVWCEKRGKAVPNFRTLAGRIRSK